MASSSLLQSYDSAMKVLLYDKFASILKIDTQSSSEEENINLGIFNFPKDVAQRVSAEKRGQTFLEFINFWRTGANFSWERNRSVLARRGMWIGDKDTEGRNTVHVQAVPINLVYDVWFWSVDRDKVYQIVEDYTFWQQNNAKITLTYTDVADNEYTLTPDIHFGSIVDESTISEQYREGIMHVFKMPIQMDAWVLKGLSYKTISKIKITFYDKDDLSSVADYSEIIVEDDDQDTEMEAALKYFSRSIYDDYSIDLTANSISVRGDFASDFVAEDRIEIWGSTDNNGVYAVSSLGATYADNITTIILDEALTSATADGTIYKG